MLLRNCLKLILIILVASSCFPFGVFAADNQDILGIFLDRVGYNPNLTVNVTADPTGVVVNNIVAIVRLAMSFFGVVFMGLILYAGWNWMLAGGNQEKLTQAKKMLVNSVIGLAIVVAAYMIVYFLMYALNLSGLLDIGVGGSSVNYDYGL